MPCDYKNEGVGGSGDLALALRNTPTPPSLSVRVALSRPGVRRVGDLWVALSRPGVRRVGDLLGDVNAAGSMTLGALIDALPGLPGAELAAPAGAELPARSGPGPARL